MLKALQHHLTSHRTDEDSQLRKLTKQLEHLSHATERLYAAVEQGLIPLDQALKERAHKLQARRQEVLLQVAALKDKGRLPVALLRPKHIRAFTRALREKLIVNRGFAKEYLRLLMDEIRVEDKQVAMRGSYAALASAVGGINPGYAVPRFALDWLPALGSN
jgi:site-specific DNA recombinase